MAEPTAATGVALGSNGAVKLEAFLRPEYLAACRACFDWSVAHPGPYATQVFRGTTHQHLNDNANPAAAQMYRELVARGPFADFLAAAWGSKHVWYYGEEIFSKEGGQAGRTPWHQDTSYGPFGGEHWANFWISFEPVPKANAIEIVKGSHHGVRYDGTAYDDPDDPTKPLWGGALPRLPDIEAERALDPTRWEILSWEVLPGDAVVFHGGTLHGGAPVDARCPHRHTLVLRFFGEDSTFQALPNGRGWFVAKEAVAHLKTGDPFRSPYFAQLR